MPSNKKKSPSSDEPRTEPKGGAVADHDAEEVTGSEADFRRFLDVAAPIPAAELFTCRAYGSLLYHNVARGVEAVKARSQEIAQHLPQVTLAELLELPSLALGLVFAISRSNQVLKAETTIKPLLKQAHAHRHVLLMAAEAAAAAGLLPAEAVAKIRAGKGPIDAAQDCVDLAALLRTNAAALANKTAVTPELLKQAAELGTELLTLLKPVREKEPASGAALAFEQRDRLYTLLVRRHAELWKVGAYLWGREVDEHVPPLHSRVVKKAK